MSILPVCVVAGLGLSKKLWIEFYEGVDLYVCLDTWKNVLELTQWRLIAIAMHISYRGGGHRPITC